MIKPLRSAPSKKTRPAGLSLALPTPYLDKAIPPLSEKYQKVGNSFYPCLAILVAMPSEAKIATSDELPKLKKGSYLVFDSFYAEEIRQELDELTKNDSLKVVRKRDTLIIKKLT